MSTRQPKPWTPERHEACKARAAAATRGPWKWWTSNSHRRLTAGDGQDGGVAYGTEHRDGCGDIVISESDMAFTESAREDVPDMLAKIEALWNEANHLADDRDRLRFIANAARTFVNDPHSARTFEVLREALDDDRATPTNEHEPDSVSPPGETLQETLDARRMKRKALADRMGVTESVVDGIVDRWDPITEDIASKLEAVLEVPAGFWLNRERIYRESLTRKAKR